MMPIRGIRERCWARPVSGHVTAIAPISVMNSRRLNSITSSMPTQASQCMPPLTQAKRKEARHPGLSAHGTTQMSRSRPDRSVWGEAGQADSALELTRLTLGGPRTRQTCKPATSFDHLVGAGEERERYGYC